MKHFEEDSLIAYQMGEFSGPEAAAIHAHLEICAACAETAGQIAETLRVFSAEPVVAPNLDHAWQRLRGSLPVSTAPRPKPSAWRLWLAVPALLAGLMVGLIVMHAHRGRQLTYGQAVPQQAARQQAGLGPGPLSTQPRDPALAAHLAQAERLLTELRHAPAGPMDAETRSQAEQFRLKNATWIRQSRSAGDGAETVVLEGVDRSLTTLGHERPEPGASAGNKGWHLQFKLSTDGLLLDLRVLEQNEAQPDAAQTAARAKE